MIQWMVIYADGRKLTNEDAEPWEIPRRGVEVVLQLEDLVTVGMEQSPEGYWVWREGRWMGTDQMGFWDYLWTEGESSVVLNGRTLTDERYLAIYNSVKDLMGVGKDGWRSLESKRAL